MSERIAEVAGDLQATAGTLAASPTPAVRIVVDRFWDDWVNPIALRELRRFLRNYTVLGLLILFLVLQLIILTLVCSFSHLRSTYSERVNLNAGRQIFIALMFLLQNAIGCLIPMYAGINMSWDRYQTTGDLMFATQLSARQVGWGKFCNGALLMLLIFSACVPFLLFSYLLRGIDLVATFIFLGIGYCIALCNLQGMLFLGSIPVSSFIRLIIGLAGFFVTLLISCGYASFIMDTLEYSRLRIGFSNPQEWATLGTVFCGLAMAWGCFFFLTVPLLESPTINRALPLRLFYTLIWLASFGLCSILCYITSNPEVMVNWFVCWLPIWIFGFFLALGGRRELSVRIRREIPKAIWRRCLAFVFYSGVTSGIVWVILMMAAHFGLFLYYFHLVLNQNWDQDVDHFYARCLNPQIQIIAYGLAALALSQFLQSKGARLQPNLTGLIAVCLALLMIISTTLYVTLYEPKYFTYGYYFVLTPAVLVSFDIEPIILSNTYMGILAGLLFCLQISFFLKQVGQFVPFQVHPLTSPDSKAPNPPVVAGPERLNAAAPPSAMLVEPALTPADGTAT